MRYTIALAAMISVTWFVWSGHTEPMMLGFGALSVILVVLAARRMGIADEEGVPLSISHMAVVVYLPWLLYQVAISALDVARRVWSPDPRLSPRLIATEPAQDTFVGKVLYANSITLTPGTISVAMYDGAILVHALHVDAAEGLLTNEMNERVDAVEGPA